MAQPHLSLDGIKEYREYLRVVDREPGTHMETKDLGSVLRAFGLKPTPQDMANYQRQVDPQNTGIIDFPQFVQFIQQVMTSSSSSSEVEEAFRAFDSKGTGYCSSDDLRKALTTLGEPLSEQDVRELLQTAGDSGGMIAYNSFITTLLGGGGGGGGY